MKKGGFTLAEVLITLGIVGVIASLTMPMLVNQSKNQANASKLSSTVSNIENALTSAMARDSVSELYDTELWEKVGTPADFVDEMEKYLQCTHVEDVYGESNIRALNKEAGETPAGDAYMLKSGAVMFISDIAEDDDSEFAATVVIDVNGATVPNTYGRDIFFYKLGAKGFLYPYGGEKVEGDYTCDIDGDGMGCAGKLLEENYKMNY